MPERPDERRPPRGGSSEVVAEAVPTVVPLSFSGDDLARLSRQLTLGLRALEELGPAVSLFGSARMRAPRPEYELARRIGRELAAAGFAVITGGGGGLMEAANRGAREAGGRSVGLSLELPGEPVPNAHLDLRLGFSFAFVRKLMFLRFASAFVVLPGGFGTLDELFDALALIQTHRVHHFPVILCDRGYWDGLVAWLAETVLAADAIGRADLELVSVVDEPAEVCAIALAAARRQAGA